MIKTMLGKTPEIDKSCFIAQNSAVIGAVKIGKNSSVWFGGVVRGDFDSITIGENTNIQDNATIHCDSTHSVVIGDYVSVGHNAVVHGAKIGNNVLVGMNSTILNGAEIGDNCIIGAGAMVPERAVIPANSLVVGIPAKAVKQISDVQVSYVRKNAEHYCEMAENYIKEGLGDIL